MQNYSSRICKVQNPQRKTPVCMINVAMPLRHQVWRYDRCANQTFHCLTPVPSVFAGKNVEAYRGCSQDIKVAENKVTIVTSTLLWQQIQLYYSTFAAYCIFLFQNSYDNRTTMILAEWTTRRTILFHVFIYIFNSLHVSSTSCPSSGETNFCQYILW